MQFKVQSAFATGQSASGVASPGMNGTDTAAMQRQRLRQLQVLHPVARRLARQSDDEPGADKPAVFGEQADVAQALVQGAGRFKPFVLPGVGAFKFHDVNRRTGILQGVINFRRQRAEADADAEWTFRGATFR